MRVWVDLANSPHVALLAPVVRDLRERGHEVSLTARDHAQTLDLARRRWPEVRAVGGPSPAARTQKARAILRRTRALRRIALESKADVAFSHGSYAQLIAAAGARIPAVTMMDYEYQPANHLSFRLARAVLVPEAFPESALRRFGARRKAVRFPGFKEELYLSGFQPDRTVLDRLGLDERQVIAVLRPPPEGALYHRTGNHRFDDVLRHVATDARVDAVLLPRHPVQAERYRASFPRLRVPPRAIDGLSLLALADLVVGAGGTMNRESALLGTPTYTVFASRLPAVDELLIRSGRMYDLRAPGKLPPVAKKGGAVALEALQTQAILGRLMPVLLAVGGQRAPGSDRGGYSPGVPEPGGSQSRHAE